MRVQCLTLRPPASKKKKLWQVEVAIKKEYCTQVPFTHMNWTELEISEDVITLFRVGYEINA
jgi:hypothetical protein